MIELQRLTGMRSGEVATMRGCDLDTTGRVWVYTPASHKTEHRGHERPIHLGPRAQEIVRPFLRTDLRAYLFSPAEAEAERFESLRVNRKTPVQPSQQRRAESHLLFVVPTTLTAQP
jgi:integrase